jgi:hypothetical protein
MSIIEIIGIIVIVLVIAVFIYYAYDWWYGGNELKCIISGVNGETYCIRERSKLKEKEAVDMLARVVEKGKKLVDYMDNTYDNEFSKQLKRNFNSTAIRENLPTSTTALTSYTENKKNIALCLNVDTKNDTQLIDESTLMFVYLHELSHVGNSTVGHDDLFWKNFKFLLQNAKELGVYEPVNYKNSPQPYCSIKLTDNPYFELGSD